jgi:hypothetical protein
MRKRVERFSWIFRTLEGHKVKVELSDPVGSVTKGDFIPSRQITVNRGSLLKSGDVLNGQGTMYLVTPLNTLGSTWRFQAHEITHILPLVRLTLVEDFVTGMMKEGAPRTIVDQLSVVMEPMGFASNQGIEDDRYKILTGQELLPGDKLGTWVVNVVQNINGIYRAEIS